MNYECIRYEKEGSIATVTIHRPEARNALNSQVRAELFDALSDAASDRDIRGVILTGGQEVFSGGADIKAMAESSPVDMLFQKETTRRVVNLIETMPKPVIASISGFALGGGCELALACDVRVASETAQMGLPEIRLGIIPGGGGTQRLSRLIGMSRAKDMIFSGKIINAEEAYRIGLVDEVVPVDQLDGAAQKKMQGYLRHGAVALAAAKTAITTGANVDLYSGDSVEKLCFSLLFSTEDQKEGMQAFIDKRKAEFKGK
ncbi:MAG: enoyl-CoA hydratase/isomerase family protein [Dethiobacter sp.]|jgi:enoyl-CoA hydratase|nr:enoyl-CoA hydratase/isomerase family protein [Dethiobacter sp.]